MLVLEAWQIKGYHPPHRYTQFVGEGSSVTLNAPGQAGRGARRKWLLQIQSAVVSHEP